MRHIHVIWLLVVMAVGCDAILGLDVDYHVRTDAQPGGGGGAIGGAGPGGSEPGGAGPGGGGAGGESCESLCVAACQSCDIAGSEGTCTANPYGDVDPACGFSNDVCDGLGGCVWIEPFPLNGQQTILASAASPGYFAIAGIFMGNVDFGDGPLVTMDTDPDVFIAVFDGHGALIRSKKVATTITSTRSVTALDVTGDGVVYLTGVVPPSGTISLDGGEPQIAAETLPYVYRWDSLTPTLEVGYLFPSTDAAGTTTLEGVAVDAARDRLIVVGTFNRPVTLPLGCGVDPIDDSVDGFAMVLSLDLATCSWATSWGTTSAEDVDAVAVDDQGFIVVAGTFSNVSIGDAMAIAGRNLGTNGTQALDVYVAKLWPDATPPTVNKEWAWSLASSGNQIDHVIDVASDGEGNVIVAGIHTGPQLVRENEFGPELILGQLNPGMRLFLVRLDDLDGAHHDGAKSFPLSSATAPKAKIESSANGVAIGGVLFGGMTAGATDLGDTTTDEVWLFAMHLDNDFGAPWVREHRVGAVAAGAFDAYMALGYPTSAANTKEALYLAASTATAFMLEGGMSFVPLAEDILLLGYQLPDIR